MTRFFIAAAVWIAASLAPALAAPAPSTPRRSALVRVQPSEIPALQDGADWKDLDAALAQSLAYYAVVTDTATVAFGDKDVPVRRLRLTLERFRKILASRPSAQDLRRAIAADFEVYRAPRSGTTSVTYSSYYAPAIPARLKPDSEYRFPIYGRPADLADVYLEKFDPRRKGERIAGRFDGREVVPYFTRDEIDAGKALAGRGLEIAWARSQSDILILQIQGSGWIELPGGAESHHIRYAGDNGRPFKSVGLNLIQSGAMPREGFSKQKMVDFLDALPDARRQAYLSHNPRYIFFELTSATTAVRGALLVSLTDGRSIASDPSLYPPGGLAWIETQRPAFAADGKFSGPAPLRRFVLNQDEGGAIKGTHRIDFFAGHGRDAERMAERLWYPGEIYFFLLKNQ